MRKIFTTLIASLCFFCVHTQGIFDASIHTAIPFGDVNSPAAESAQQIIDQDPMTKFLDFNTLDGMGFEVNLGDDGGKKATSIAIVTANDAPERDPTEYEVFGSNDGVEYISIATGTIPCIPDRFLSRTFAFSNVIPYTIYRINFTGNCSPTNIIQVADVQLFELIGTAPTISCPESLTIDTSPGECSGIPDFTVTAADAEDGTIMATQVLGSAPGSSFPIGVSAVVYEVSDSDGNSISCDFTVEVIDTENPTFNCPEAIVANINTGETTAVVDFEVSASDNCSVINPKDGFTPLGTIDGKSYYLSDEAFTPEEAIFLHAVDNGGVVGTIRSEADNEYILNAVSMLTGGVASILIGYTDLSEEGVFEWISEDPSTYANWNDGEPNNSGANGDPENYTVMLGSGLWNDVESIETETYRYLLETDFVLEQTAGLASGSAFPLGTTTNTFTTSDASGNSFDCEFTVTVDNASALEDQLLAEGLIFSPNPVNDQVTISNMSDVALERVSIYDIYGRQLYSVELNALRSQQRLDVSSLPAGIYSLYIEGEGGSVTRKIIKQ